MRLGGPLVGVAVGLLIGYVFSRLGADECENSGRPALPTADDVPPARPRAAQEADSRPALHVQVARSRWKHQASDPTPSLPHSSLNDLGRRHGSKRYGGTKEAPAPGVAGHDRWLENFLGPLRKQRTKVRVLLLGPLQKADAEVFREYFAPSGVHVMATNAAPDVGQHVERLDGPCTQDLVDRYLGRESIDVVVDSGSGAAEQLESLRGCFSALKGGGVWAVEGIGSSYDLGARTADLDPIDLMSAAKLLIDMVNVHFWDKKQMFNMLPGVPSVETVYFADDFVAITRIREWTNEYSGLPLAFFATHGRPKGAPIRACDSVSGWSGSHHSYEYYAGDAEVAWQNPPCSKHEARFGVPDERIAHCAAALDEVHAMAAAATEPLHPHPKMGAGWPLTEMDKLATGIQWNLTDKVYHHRFDRWYTWYMEDLRQRKIKMMEIGMFLGGSAKLWTRYFKNAKVYGVDLEAPALDAASEQTGNKVEVLWGDQSNVSHMQRVTREAGPGTMDIIIDDGGHAHTHQVNTFKVMFKDLLKPGGLYTIEDIETSYWGWNKAYGVRFTSGLQKRGTMMEVAKLFVDTVNRRLWDPKRSRCVMETGADAQIESIQFARNVIILTKKGRYGKAWDDRPRPEPVPSGPARSEPPLSSRRRSVGRTWDGYWYMPRPQCEPTSDILHSKGGGGRKKGRR